jgi:hypothetical protein
LNAGSRFEFSHLLGAGSGGIFHPAAVGIGVKMPSVKSMDRAAV